MSYLHVVVPYESPSICSRRRFSTAFPSQLGPFMMPEEFVQHINSINSSINKASGGPILASIFCWILYALSLNIILNPGLLKHRFGEDNFRGGIYVGIGMLVVSLIGVIAANRWLMNRRVKSMNEAIATTNAIFNQRGLAWRLVNPGVRSMTIEIGALPQIAPPVPQQIPIGINQAMPQAHYQPYFAHPPVASPEGYSAHPAQQFQAHPQPQYVHASAPAYPIVHPAEQMNTPLINRAY